MHKGKDVEANRLAMPLRALTRNNHDNRAQDINTYSSNSAKNPCRKIESRDQKSFAVFSTLCAIPPLYLSCEMPTLFLLKILDILYK